jgi:hypothetical protein
MLHILPFGKVEKDAIYFTKMFDGLGTEQNHSSAAIFAAGNTIQNVLFLMPSLFLFSLCSANSRV